MDTALVAVIGIIVLAILGTGILFVTRSKEGSFGWDIKTRLVQVSTRFKGEPQPDIQQTQSGGEANQQIASSEVKSRQVQTEGKQNVQRIK